MKIIKLIKDLFKRIMLALRKGAGNSAETIETIPQKAEAPEYAETVPDNEQIVIKPMQPEELSYIFFSLRRNANNYRKYHDKPKMRYVQLIKARKYEEKKSVSR